MTETDKMRAILRERGIEYRDVNSMVTDVEHDGIKTRIYDYDDGPDYQLCVEQKWLTAEEAARVALGIKPQKVLERRIDELCEENAKLRKLCRSALVVLENNCSQCAYFYDCDIFTDCKCVAPKKIRAELRELGVEVSQ